MKLSIITASYNQGAFIEKNIRSVISQNWLYVEHIVIDGGSTDNTVKILKKYPHVRWVSEKDEGQADALNKGLAMATGEIIGWINSDDYYENNIFADVVKEFENESIQWIIGNITLKFLDSGKEVRDISPRISYKQLLRNPDIVRQQATFFRKTALERVGGWDKSLYMTMDYDLWLKLSRLSEPLMVDKCWAYFTLHLQQKSSLRNSLVQIENIKRILDKEGANKIIVFKILSKKYFYYLKGILKECLYKLNVI